MDDSLATIDGVAVPSSRPGALAPWQARRVLRHIADNLETTTRVADLADVARLSVSHFAHAFRATFDVSPATLIRRQRLQRASTMVLAGQLPLAQIALACGFTDQAHMSRLFRRHLDLPPARWRFTMRKEARVHTVRETGGAT
jgi:AraC family transcriptional regulator